MSEALSRRSSPLRTFKAVAWSFLGIRKASGYREDVSSLNPVHVVAAGVIATALFVLGVIALVNWIVGSGVAA